jgi:hypothetical protein
LSATCSGLDKGESPSREILKLPLETPVCGFLREPAFALFDAQEEWFWKLSIDFLSIDNLYMSHGQEK